MIGAELADRVSPVSMLRPELLVDDGANDCFACGMPHTACRHSDFSPEALEDDQVAPRGQAQPGAKRGPGRPPSQRPGPAADPTVAADPPVVTPAAPADVVEEAVVPGGVVEAPVTPVAGPTVAPVGPQPTETVTQPSVAPQGVAAAPVVAAEPPMIRPPGPNAPIGADFGAPGVQSISPIDPALVPRVSAVSVGAHAQGEGGVSVYDVPLGYMDPADDPHRPDALLVSDEAQLFATGAWRMMSDGLSAEITEDVQVVYWQNSMRSPMYRQFCRKSTKVPTRS